MLATDYHLDGIRHGQPGIVLQLSAAGWVTVQFQDDEKTAAAADNARPPLVRTVQAGSIAAVKDPALAAAVGSMAVFTKC